VLRIASWKFGWYQGRRRDRHDAGAVFERQADLSPELALAFDDVGQGGETFAAELLVLAEDRIVLGRADGADFMLRVVDHPRLVGDAHHFFEAVKIAVSLIQLPVVHLDVEHQGVQMTFELGFLLLVADAGDKNALRRGAKRGELVKLAREGAGVRRRNRAERRVRRVPRQQGVDLGAVVAPQRMVDAERQPRLVLRIEHAERAGGRVGEQPVIGEETDVRGAAGGQRLDEAGGKRRGGAVVERLQTLLEVVGGGPVHAGDPLGVETRQLVLDRGF
jgi:hypothetical protein